MFRKTVRLDAKLLFNTCWWWPSISLQTNFLPSLHPSFFFFEKAVVFLRGPFLELHRAPCSLVECPIIVHIKYSKKQHQIPSRHERNVSLHNSNNNDTLECSWRSLYNSFHLHLMMIPVLGFVLKK